MTCDRCGLDDRTVVAIGGAPPSHVWPRSCIEALRAENERLAAELATIERYVRESVPKSCGDGAVAAVTDMHDALFDAKAVIAGLRTWLKALRRGRRADVGICIREVLAKLNELEREVVGRGDEA